MNAAAILPLHYEVEVHLIGQVQLYICRVSKYSTTGVWGKAVRM
jgi:hypothetical protein